MKNLYRPATMTVTTVFTILLLVTYKYQAAAMTLILSNSNSFPVQDSFLKTLSGFLTNDVDEPVNITTLNLGAKFQSGLCSELSTSPSAVVDISRNADLYKLASSTAKEFEVPLISYQPEEDCNQEPQVAKNLQVEKTQVGDPAEVRMLSPPDISMNAILDIIDKEDLNNVAMFFDSGIVNPDTVYNELVLRLQIPYICQEIVKSHDTTKEQMIVIKENALENVFVVSKITEADRLVQAGQELRMLLANGFKWYVITFDQASLTPSIGLDYNYNTMVVHMKPFAKQKLLQMPVTKELEAQKISIAPQHFWYTDLLTHTARVVRQLQRENKLTQNGSHECKIEQANLVGSEKLQTTDLVRAFEDVSSRDLPYGIFLCSPNATCYQETTYEVYRVALMLGKQKSRYKPLGTWSISSGLLKTSNNSLLTVSGRRFYKITTNIDTQPFMMLNPKANSTGNDVYMGFCKDMIDLLATELNFDYYLYTPDDGEVGRQYDNGTWTGMVRELILQNADMAVSPFSVVAEREAVIDYTAPFFEQVGILISMKALHYDNSLLKFANVLEGKVWICIVAALFGTSIILCVFDTISPYSYQNNKEKYANDNEKRVFTLKESLWFCMTSLTPQGGGEVPKNLSGKFVAGTWWIFGFVILASYTANLAAFLTVQRFDASVKSLDDLAKQHDVSYSALEGSSSKLYFERMKDIEYKFYEIWKDMSLNISVDPAQKAKFAVWEYPLSEKYTRIWNNMVKTGFQNTVEEGFAKVRASEPGKFAFMEDATIVNYMADTDCDLVAVGEQFSKKPYAIGVPKGSPLKEELSNAILKLQSERKLEDLKRKWWKEKATYCPSKDNQNNGVTFWSIRGVFLIVPIGIVLSLIALLIEHCYYRERPKSKSTVVQPISINVKEPAQDVKEIRY